MDETLGVVCLENTFDPDIKSLRRVSYESGCIVGNEFTPGD